MRDEDDDIEDGEDDAPAPAAKPTKPVLPRLVKPGDAAPSAPLGGAQLARVVRPSAEQEVVEMLAEQTRFASDPETRAVACQLLASGYTVRDVSRRLKVRPHIVWQWSEDPGIKSSIEKGRELRRRSLGQELEDAAEAALSTLVDLMNDDAVTPKDRLKAAELVLDRCGLVEVATKAATTTETVVKVDVDFDERLARIVAGQRTSG
jgi:hypothetical protein